MQFRSKKALLNLIFGGLCALLSSFSVVLADGDDYRLGAGDLLKISAFGYPDLTTEVRVAQSGNITFPLVGELAVSGLSTRDTESLLAQRLADGGFIPKAQVSVLVLEYESQKISVMGQVAKPGQYPLTRSYRVLDLLAAAGGLISATAGDATAGDQATVLRRDGTKIDIDLTAMFEGDPTQNPSVAAGDTIYVPKAAQFYIYGEVQRPGVYRLERNMTVSRAVSAGGGLTRRGSERNAIVKRRDAQGREKKFSVAGSDLVQPNDVLRVRESWF
jgi:polysaccharide biosynthesis/export protein